MYEYADGVQQLPSSYKAKCNVTGELVPIYHKFLDKMVRDKYKNNFAYFLKHFAKKGAELKKKETEGPDPYALNAYSDYLVISYKGCLTTLEDNFNEQAVRKTKKEMEHIKYCFMKNFNRDIEKYV